MEFKKEVLPVGEKLYKKVEYLCNFNNLKMEFKEGFIFRIKETNINFIEPHRYFIKIEDINIILLSYDNYNLSLYNKDNIIDFGSLRNLIKDIKRLYYGA